MDISLIAAIGAAASDPTRVTILARVDGRLSVAELATAVGVCPSTASHHISVLKKAGLIHVATKGRCNVPSKVPQGWLPLARALG